MATSGLLTRLLSKTTGQPAHDLADWVLPTQCLLCLQAVRQHLHWHALCDSCWQDTSTSILLRCTRCAARMSVQHAHTMCGACLRKPPTFDASIAGIDYRPPADTLIITFKFAHQLSYALPLAALLHDAIMQQHSQGLRGLGVDVLIPMPLARERLAQRGFNQAQELAQALTKIDQYRCGYPESLSIPRWDDALIKPIETEHQALLPLEERAHNIKGAFILNPMFEDRVRGKSIAVVDDVLTTGSTLNEAARCLKKAGATRVINLIAARTP